MSLSRQQDRFYWREWSVARRALRASGLPPAECDAKRHSIHLEELGADKSHRKFTEDDFDAVLAGFWKISYPGDLARQLRQLNMRKTRMFYTIDGILERMGKTRRFAEGVFSQIEDGIDPNSADAFWQHERERSGEHRALDKLTPDELKKVISALRAISKRSSASHAPARDRARDRSPAVQPVGSESDPF